MKDDVVINKLATIERCLSRITEVYQQAGDGFFLIILVKIQLF
jgi:hypothetical protein